MQTFFSHMNSHITLGPPVLGKQLSMHSNQVLDVLCTTNTNPAKLLTGEKGLFLQRFGIGIPIA